MHKLLPPCPMQLQFTQVCSGCVVRKIVTKLGTRIQDRIVLIQVTINFLKVFGVLGYQINSITANDEADFVSRL